MKSIEVKGTARTIAERSSEQARALKEIRKNGGVPCVLYGGNEVVHFTVTNEGLRNLVYTPHIYLVELNIDGKNHGAIMKEIQFHPTTDAILHIDFYEVNETKPIVMGVPVKHIGLAQGVRDGGRMNKSIRKIDVKAPYAQIPETLDIDVTKLRIGKSIKVGDLSFEGLELVTSKDVVVCSIKNTRNAVASASTDDEEGDGSAAE